MSTSKATRVLKVIAWILGILLLGYVGIAVSAFRSYRAHSYTISSVPGGLSDDATVLRLAQSALRLHGTDPSSYTPGTYAGGVTVGHNTVNSNRVTTHWLSRSPNTPGLGVALEQHGSNVVCYVTRLK